MPIFVKLFENEWVSFSHHLVYDRFITIYACYFSDIEAQIKEIQARKKNLNTEENGVTEKSRIGLGESGYFDQEIYDGGGSKFDGYVTSIAANDEVDVSILTHYFPFCIIYNHCVDHWFEMLLLFLW